MNEEAPSQRSRPHRTPPTRVQVLKLRYELANQENQVVKYRSCI